MSEPTEVASIRSRREALFQAVVGLEDALAGPIGDHEHWRLRVAMAVDHAVARISEHIAETEGPGNILEEIVSVAPRLDTRVKQMKVDHENLEKAAHRLAAAVAELSSEHDGLDEEQLEDAAITVRNQAVEVMGQITRHRQRGADLIYEAYHVDLGNSS